MSDYVCPQCGQTYDIPGVCDVCGVDLQPNDANKREDQEEGYNDNIEEDDLDGSSEYLDEDDEDGTDDDYDDEE